MTHPIERASVEQARRQLSHHEQMLDAQRQCVPCKLCGGSAFITDAGSGAGYYITCENGRTFRDHEGCLINQRRLGGWAYNVMDWWNRLHRDEDRQQARDAGFAEGVERAAEVVRDLARNADCGCKPCFGHVERSDTYDECEEAIKALSAEANEGRCDDQQ